MPLNYWACKCRVRRDELFDHAHDASSNDGDAPSDAGAAGGLDEGAERELRSRLNAQLSGLLDFDIAPAPAAAPAPADQAGGGEEADEEEFEFRLFRDEAPGESHKVVIQQNEDVIQGEGAFVVPRRPDAYYVAAAPDTAALQRFRHAAVSPDHILADAGRRRCWGLERPWRVVRVSVSGKVLKGLMDGPSGAKENDDDVDADSKKKKRRPGKKRRIILRTRAKAEKEKAEAARKFLEGKEEHLKAKKQRLNREKKLKRRAKDKEKKAAAAGGVAGSDAGDVSMADYASNDGSAA